MFQISFNQSASTTRQIALAKMLVIVSFIFILTSSPIVALSIARGIVYDFFINRRYTNIFIAAHTSYMQLSMINCSAVNFFVYVLRSSRFRQELSRCVCFGFLKQKKAGAKKEGVSVSTVASGVSAVCSSEAL